MIETPYLIVKEGFLGISDAYIIAEGWAESWLLEKECPRKKKHHIRVDGTERPLCMERKKGILRDEVVVETTKLPSFIFYSIRYTQGWVYSLNQDHDMTNKNG